MQSTMLKPIRLILIFSTVSLLMIMNSAMAKPLEVTQNTMTANECKLIGGSTTNIVGVGTVCCANYSDRVICSPCPTCSVAGLSQPVSKPKLNNSGQFQSPNPSKPKLLKTQ